MKSLQELYRIGLGPSRSHTMGPRFAATAFSAANPTAARLRVTLYGTLAATGRGHLTDLAVSAPFSPTPVDIVWLPALSLPRHPNGMQFEALDASGRVLAARVVYSVGGGALLDEDGQPDGGGEVYPHAGMDAVLDETEREGLRIWEIVDRHEGPAIWSHLASVWRSMQQTIATGLNAEGRLPGTLHVPRKASAYHARAQSLSGYFGQTALQFAYALAVSEENAAGGEVVTAPTCGACGVLPAVLFFLQQNARLPDEKIHRALATAGMIGNIVKRNASISGAEVGCQGEVGTACAMAAGAAAQLLGGSVRQIEYAAEMGLEHHLGLTCDPIGGYVQIPCIERNAIAAVRAVDCAAYALLSDGHHILSFDEVVRTMWETGCDLKAGYRETARGGLARIHALRGQGASGFQGMGS
ncbi:MAG TPA: L-serine ammonia-lyase [Candidatus Accumulibacter phosphatis]|nr:L-serine ammonia-lyase [Candidatus Accumulibacter phosphatis]HRQ97142.1 L-serine ammonia-lyase [Candidatus Accumulibacter phosphatis]